MPRKVEQAQPIDRNETPAPKVTPGAGLATEPEKATPEEAAALALPHERATIYDDQGNALFQKDAEPSNPKAVSFSDEELRQLRGQSFSHNHTGAGAFSRANFLFAHAHDLTEMRVIATDLENRPVLYRLRRPEGGWPVDFVDAEARYRAATARIAPALMEDIKAGRLTEAQANAELEHRTVEALLAEHPGSFNYERIAL